MDMQAPVVQNFPEAHVCQHPSAGHLVPNSFEVLMHSCTLPRPCPPGAPAPHTPCPIDTADATSTRPSSASGSTADGSSTNGKPEDDEPRPAHHGDAQSAWLIECPFRAPRMMLCSCLLVICKPCSNWLCDKQEMRAGQHVSCRSVQEMMVLVLPCCLLSVSVAISRRRAECACLPMRKPSPRPAEAVCECDAPQASSDDGQVRRAGSSTSTANHTLAATHGQL